MDTNRSEKTGKTRTGSSWVRRLATVGAVAGAAVIAGTTLAGPANAIIGGEQAKHTYPFMVTLHDDKGVHYCGATLIAPQWVATAGHCSHVPVKKVTAHIGTANVDKGGTVRHITKIVRNPKYTADPENLRYDIALMKLAKPVKQKPARIASWSSRPGTTVRVLGWGMTCEDGNECPNPPVKLKQLNTKIVPDGRCTEMDPASDICSQHPTQKAQVCTLDSGGPMVKYRHGRWVLAGITSRDGNEKADPSCVGPGVFTDVAAYRTWIQRTTGMVGGHHGQR